MIQPLSALVQYSKAALHGYGDDQGHISSIVISDLLFFVGMDIVIAARKIIALSKMVDALVLFSLCVVLNPLLLPLHSCLEGFGLVEVICCTSSKLVFAFFSFGVPRMLLVQPLIWRACSSLPLKFCGRAGIFRQIISAGQTHQG